MVMNGFECIIESIKNFPIEICRVLEKISFEYTILLLQPKVTFSSFVSIFSFFLYFKTT